MTTVAVVTLGCEKNTVDSERYRAQLVAHGAVAVDDPADAEVIVINTCGFIDAAKRESLDAIVEAGNFKESGSCRAVVAVGCMVQRHHDELVESLSEVDLFLGSSQVEQLIPRLQALGLVGDAIALHPGVRIPASDLPHLRYLKASEGCDHGCAFCAIPLMRGKHRSFSSADILHEAQLLEMQGAREVNLVAQDLAHYGRDLRNGNDLTSLLHELLAGTSVPWYRLLYLYSAGITDPLLELMAAEPRILPYLDMPVQHAADDILKSMRRPERLRTIREKVSRARDVVPDIAIRTTVIVGFPGEEEQHFETLLQFLEEMRFTSVGCFTYSPQEGTRAWELADSVPESLKRERQERVSELQRALVSERNSDAIGRADRVIVDATFEGGSEGRFWWQAHEIDGAVELDSEVAPGSIVEAQLTGVVNDYDVLGSVRRVIIGNEANLLRESHLSGGQNGSGKLGRKLPLMLQTVGSFGK